MTREEIKNTPEIVDFMLSESVMSDSKEKLHKRLEEICNLAIQVIEQEPVVAENATSDCISRAAVDNLSRDLVHVTRDKADFLCNFWEGLNALPPVTPQPKAEQELTTEWINGYMQGVDNMSKEFKYECKKCKKEQEPKVGHWINDKTIYNWRCSECGNLPCTLGYVGDRHFMQAHFKYCNHCGARMSEVNE